MRRSGSLIVVNLQDYVAYFDNGVVGAAAEVEHEADGMHCLSSFHACYPEGGGSVGSEGYRSAKKKLLSCLASGSSVCTSFTITLPRSQLLLRVILKS